MSKYIRISTTFIALLITYLCIQSCKKDDSPTDQPGLLVGTWQMTSDTTRIITIEFRTDGYFFYKAISHEPLSTTSTELGNYTYNPVKRQIKLGLPWSAGIWKIRRLNNGILLIVTEESVQVKFVKLH